MFLFWHFFVKLYKLNVVLDWWGGHYYGQRRLVFSLPIFAFGLEYWFKKIRVNCSTIYKKYILATTILSGLSDFNLTMIHVFSRIINSRITF